MTDLSPIILYSITGLSDPSYHDKTKRTNKKDKQKRTGHQKRYSRSLTPIIFYDIIGLSHPSCYNKTKRTNNIDIHKYIS